MFMILFLFSCLSDVRKKTVMICVNDGRCQLSIWQSLGQQNSGNRHKHSENQRKFNMKILKNYMTTLSVVYNCLTYRFHGFYPHICGGFQSDAFVNMTGGIAESFTLKVQHENIQKLYDNLTFCVQLFAIQIPWFLQSYMWRVPIRCFC